MAKNVVNLDELATRMALKSSFNIQDMKKLFKQLTNEIELALQQGEKVKIGKLFILSPQQRKAHSHYDPVNDIYVDIPVHKTYKLVKLKKFKQIEKGKY